jgi:RNA polymerase sigma factor for flagellar operon FliA
MKAEINKYQQNFDTEQGMTHGRHRDELILKYAPLVKSIADRMAIRLPPHISNEELNSAGIVGLLDALDKFDVEMGIKFKTYAEHRIRGAMLDELRKLDWVPRSVRKDIHSIEDATTTVQYRLGREPEDFEVAEEMGVDLEVYYKKMSKTQGVGLLSLDAIMPDGLTSVFAKHSSEDPSPLDELKIKELKKIISNALLSLSEKEQLVISLYYYDELTLKEIAKVRISQIHSKAIIRLRAKLKAYYES